ncbi:MAG TPA: hypothetical protein VMU39_31065 [Solirubrobacteraceae bacterium]|nr:hypothetical protein [Solirubrobacteraceae bacterium]
MGFFRRFAEGLGHSTRVEGLAEAASSWGWEPAGDEPFDPELTDLIHGVLRTLHGAFRGTGGIQGVETAHTNYHDAYRATEDGRAVTVANAWSPVEAVVAGGRRVEGVAAVGVELSTALMIAGIEPRGRHNSIAGPELPTGNSSFDATYRVVGMGPLAEGVVTPEMQQRIAARDDWAFIAHDTTFLSICREPFATPDEVSQRVRDVLAIVAALPASVAPVQVDHSVDDLLVRIARIDNIDDALAFLQELTDADRQRLAASPTPFAKFADVHTPDEAIARMMSLPDTERLQVLAMFEKADRG